MRQVRRIDFVFCQQAFSSAQVLVFSDLVGNAHPGQFLISADHGGIHRTVMCHYGLCHRMCRKAFAHGAQPKQLVGRQRIIQWGNTGDGKFSGGQGTGFIKDGIAGFGQGLQRFGAFDQYTAAASRADACKEGQGNRNNQCAGAGGD